MSDFPVPNGATFLFIGDSITDCDRTTYAAPHGNGYVRTFIDLVTYHHPERDIRWINRGVGGDVITGLQERWDADVLAHEPSWLAILIGINDCHGNLGGDDDWAEDAYRTAYVDLLDRVQPLKPRLVLLDPFYMADDSGPWPTNAYQSQVLQRLAAYLRVVKEMAGRYGAVHVRLQEMFARQLQHRPPTRFGPEPVHPYPMGHTLVALELYQTLCGGRRKSERRKPERRSRRLRQYRGRR